MPIGSYSIVSHVARELASARPGRVLDLGTGFGLYGAVVREWLDFGVRPFATYLVGVEGWERYGNPLWDLYNLMIVDSIENYLARGPERFDFVLLCDVLEHFARDEGRLVIDSARNLVTPGGRFLVATPAAFFEQDAVHGNEFERHRSCWTAADLEALGFDVLLRGDEAQLGNPMLLGVWRNP